MIEVLGPPYKLPERIIRRLARHPLLVVGAASLGYRVTKDAVELKTGKIDGKEFRARTGGHVGSISGGVLGASAGAIAGSVVPVLGTILGSFAGGIIGEMGGSKIGRMAVEHAETLVGQAGPARDPDLGAKKRDL